jgi:hypothetical protein
VDTLQQVGDPFEIIMVEDSGGDGSWEVIKELASRDARVRGIRHSCCAARRHRHHGR